MHKTNVILYRAICFFLFSLFHLSVQSQSDNAAKSAPLSQMAMVGASVVLMNIGSKYTITNSEENVADVGLNFTYRYIYRDFYMDFSGSAAVDFGVLGDAGYPISSYAFQSLHFLPGYFLLNTEKVSIGANAGVAIWRISELRVSLDNQANEITKKSSFHGNDLSYGLTVGMNQYSRVHRWYAISYQVSDASFGKVRMVCFSIGSNVNFF